MLITEHGINTIVLDEEILQPEELKRQRIRLEKQLGKLTAELDARNKALQIEACLERIRARAMAMRHSDELSDVLAVMFEQFDILGIHPVYGCLDLFDLDSNNFTHRITGTRGHRHIVEQVIDLDAMDVWQESVEQWKEGEPESCQLLHYGRDQMSEVWELFSGLYDSLPEEARFTQDDFPDGMYSCAGFHQHGYIGFFHKRATTAEENEIVVRFAREFDRLYRRFLDLQKAEAQARRAHIEAALERVRARTMSMHASHELSETAALLFKELRKLEIHDLWMCGFAICEKDNPLDQFWLSTESGEMSKLLIPNTEDPAHIRMYQGWESGSDYLAFKVEGEELDEHYSYLRTIREVRQDFEAMESKGFPLPDFQQLHSVYFSSGYLLIVTLKPFSDSNLLLRFGNVFDQTYTRFKDLQKAEEQARRIRLVNEENERLLHSILPKQIVEQIRMEHKTIVKRFDQVSILFADIVGFTVLSEKLEPDKVVDLLNGLFSVFDDLTSKFGLEKIKTVGDAYMVAAGVPEEREQHATILFQYAQDMLQSLQEYNDETGSDLSLRIGMSSGPVVAGVIGKTKFAYDLWGDSVNTAARMEAYGQPGRIQVSPTSYELLKDDYAFEKLSDVAIKGKGKMDVYLWMP